MNCPQCGGEVWNNAQKNEQRARDGKKPMPLFTCKDKDGCGWVKWPPKGQKPTSEPGAGRTGGSPASGAARRPLGPLYYDCLKIAKSCVEKEVKGALPADIIAAAATLFIAASRDGTPLVAPKPKPAPPPPPEPTYDDDGADQQFDSEDSLPF